jgi:hypothetical protein
MDKDKNWIIISIAAVLILLFIQGLICCSKKKVVTIVNQEPQTIKNQRKPVDTSNWNTYINKQLGFSIETPPEVYSSFHCGSDFEPVRILEDNADESVYIFQDYYDNGQDGQCLKIVRSLDDLIKETGVAPFDYFPKPIFGWDIMVNDVKNDQDVLKYVKQNFGSTCIISSKELQQDGSYQIVITGSDGGKDGGPWYGTCSLDFAHKVIYLPQKNKMMSVQMGQECTFQNSDPVSSSDYQCYDEDMIKSFKLE